MADDLTPPERSVFGHKARRHLITGYVLEDGRGAAPIDRQAERHCELIERREGKAAGDAMRKRLAAATGDVPMAAVAKVEHGLGNGTRPT